MKALLAIALATMTLSLPSPARAESVFGLELDQPLKIPRCNFQIEDAPERLKSGACNYLHPGTAPSKDLANIVFAAGELPGWVSAGQIPILVGRIVDGRLAERQPGVQVRASHHR